MNRKKVLTLNDYHCEVSIRQEGLCHIYPADSAMLSDWERFLHQHWEDEDVCWKPPFFECIFQDQEALVRAEKAAGEKRGAIPLSPILTEAIRIAMGRVPSIPDDLFQLKHLTVKPPGRHSLSPDYCNFTQWQGRYVFIRDGRYLSSDFHYLSCKFYPSPGDWSAIGRMKKLKTLTIKYLALHDFDFLAQLVNLQQLDLSGTTFAQDELLAGLKNLQQLDLAETNFSDCRVLLQLPKLKRVNLAHCPLQNKEALEQLTADIWGIEGF